MKLALEDLLGLLRLAKPALADAKNQLEQLAHFWFDGKVLSAFDGVFGVQVDFDTDFTGGVLGDKLLRVLTYSRAKSATLGVTNDNNLVLKAGSHVKLAMLPIEQWFWHPAVPKVPPLTVTKEFIAAIKSVLFSVGQGKIMTPSQRGVTLIQNGSGVDVYSTDLATVSWQPLKLKQKLLTQTERVILPTLFCEQLCRYPAGGLLMIDKNAAYLETEAKIGDINTNVLLFAKLVDEEKPAAFHRVAEKYKAAVGLFEVPKRLQSSIEQALVILPDGHSLEIGVTSDGNLTLMAQSNYGHLDDVLRFTDAHPRVLVKVNPALFKRGLKDREKLAITRDCVVFTGPGSFVHIVATR